MLSLFGFNKKKESPLQEVASPKVEIIIEGSNNLYENEQEIILQGARVLFQNGKADSIEDGIITFATMFRGLKYGGIEKDDEGNIKILLRDMTLENQGRFR